MTDLIKRDDALTLVEQWFDTDDYRYSTIINDITNLPAIDLTSTLVADIQPADAVVNAPNQIFAGQGIDQPLDELEQALDERDDALAKMTKAVEALRGWGPAVLAELGGEK